MCIYAENPEIPLTYSKLFETKDKTLRPIQEMSKFINLARKDMSYGDAIIDTTNDRYKFINVQRKD